MTFLLILAGANLGKKVIILLSYFLLKTGNMCREFSKRNCVNPLGVKPKKRHPLLTHIKRKAFNIVLNTHRYIMMCNYFLLLFISGVFPSTLKKKPEKGWKVCKNNQNRFEIGHIQNMYVFKYDCITTIMLG